MAVVSSALVATAIAAFTATNIDNFVLLVGWFAVRLHRPGNIAFGQLLATAILSAASAIIAWFSLKLPEPMTGLLGALPIGIGVVRFVRRSAPEIQRPMARSALVVTGVAIANGSDNIAVYVALFATQTGVQIGAISLLFMLMTGVWLATAFWFVNHPTWSEIVQRWGNRLVPWVLIWLGARVIYDAGTIAWLVRIVTD